MRVAICIVAYRNPADIHACLAALSRQTYCDFTVVICENGGDAAWQALAEQLPAQLIGGQTVTVTSDATNPGYAGGVNRCIKISSSADAFWILNPDTEPSPTALAALVGRLAYGTADAVGGIIHLPDGRITSCGGHWQPWLGYSTSLGMGRTADHAPSPAEVEGRLSFISGGSLLCTRNFVEQSGLMREDYFLYGEEVEWCLRATRLGLRLGYAPDAFVLHHQGSSTGSDKGFAERGRLPVYCDERNRILTLRDTAPWLWPIGAAGALATILVRYGRRQAWNQLQIALTAWRHGVMNRRGRPDWMTER